MTHQRGATTMLVVDGAIVASLRAYVFYKQEDFTEFAFYIERLTQQDV